MKGNFIEQILENELAKRKESNSAYSLRSFAKDLNIDPPSLSRIIRGERGIPSGKIQGVVEKLKLSGKEKEKFFFECKNKKLTFKKLASMRTPKFPKIDMKLRQKFVEEWEYAAIIALFNTSYVVEDKKWISRRLNLPLERVNEVFSGLLALKMIEKDSNGKYKVLETCSETTHGVP